MTDYSKTFGTAPTPVTMVPAPEPKGSSEYARDYSNNYRHESMCKGMQAAQGKLVVGPETTCGYVEGYELPINLNGQRIGAVDSDEDARRLAACWNACEGFKTSTLEQETFMHSLGNARDREWQLSDRLFVLEAELAQKDRVISLREADLERAVDETMRQRERGDRFLALAQQRDKEIAALSKALNDAEGRRMHFNDRYIGARNLLAEALPHINPKAINFGAVRSGPVASAYLNTRIRMFLVDQAASDRAEMRRFPLTPIAERARDLVAEATAAGVVLTVEQRPRAPLAMGNYDTVVSLRAARGAA